MKLKNLVVNCFSIRNNGGYRDIINSHEGEYLDKVGYHMFIEELADELMAYNDMLDDSCKVNLTRKDAIAQAINEATKATQGNIVSSVSCMEIYDTMFDRLVNGEYPIKFA